MIGNGTEFNSQIFLVILKLLLLFGVTLKETRIQTLSLATFCMLLLRVCMHVVWRTVLAPTATETWERLVHFLHYLPSPLSLSKKKGKQLGLAFGLSQHHVPLASSGRLVTGQKKINYEAVVGNNVEAVLLTTK